MDGITSSNWVLRRKNKRSIDLYKNRPRLIKSVESCGKDLSAKAVTDTIARSKKLLIQPEEKPTVASRNGTSIDKERVRIFQGESPRKTVTIVYKAKIGTKKARYRAISFFARLKERLFQQLVLTASKAAKNMAATANMMRIGLE